MSKTYRVWPTKEGFCLLSGDEGMQRSKPETILTALQEVSSTTHLLFPPSIGKDYGMGEYPLPLQLEERHVTELLEGAKHMPWCTKSQGKGPGAANQDAGLTAVIRHPDPTKSPITLALSADGVSTNAPFSNRGSRLAALMMYLKFSNEIARERDPAYIPAGLTKPLSVTLELANKGDKAAQQAFSDYIKKFLHDDFAAACKMDKSNLVANAPALGLLDRPWDYRDDEDGWKAASSKPDAPSSHKTTLIVAAMTSDSACMFNAGDGFCMAVSESDKTTVLLGDIRETGQEPDRPKGMEIQNFIRERGISGTLNFQFVGAPLKALLLGSDGFEHSLEIRHSTRSKLRDSFLSSVAAYGFEAVHKMMDHVFGGKFDGDDHTLVSCINPKLLPASASSTPALGSAPQTPTTVRL